MASVASLGVQEKRDRTRPSDVGGGGAVRRRCCARWRFSGEGLGDERALRLAMLGEREVVEAVLRDCEDIALHDEQRRNLSVLAVEHDVGEVEIAVRVYDVRGKYLPKGEFPIFTALGEILAGTAGRALMLLRVVP